MPEIKTKVMEETQDHAYLGREFLAWLMWRVDIGEAEFGDNPPFVVRFGGRLRMQGLVGDVTDAVLKGRGPAYAVEARAGVGAGRAPSEAEILVTRGDREWRCTLAAETLDLRSVKIPALLTDEEDDRILERLALLDELDGMIRACFEAFVRERVCPVWQRTLVPAMRAWVANALEVDGGDATI